MKLLSKISLVTLMAIAPLAHAAQQDAKAAVDALTADMNKTAYDFYVEKKISWEQKQKLDKERLTKLVDEVEQGKVPKGAVNSYIAYDMYGANKQMQNYKQYRTPLFEAVELQDLELAKKLIKLGADVDIPYKEAMNEYETPLLMAIKLHYQSLVTELIKATKNINWAASTGLTALKAAVPDPSLVQQVLDAGADINMKTENKFVGLEARTALDEARDAVNTLKDLRYTDKDRENAAKTVKILEAAQAKK
jgi:hypothetical protein